MKLNKKELKEIIQKQSINVFLCSSSFEDRCFSIPKAIAELDNNITVNKIFYISDLDDKTRTNKDKLEEILNQEKNSSIELFMDTKKLNITFKNLCQAIDTFSKIKEPQNILIDATTFTHEILLILIKILKNKLKNEDKLFIAYNGAEEYSINERENKNKWLSKGVNAIRSIIGYPGYLNPSRPSLLLIIFGFEKERTMKIIDCIEFNSVSLAFGPQKESINDSIQKINQDRHENILNSYSNINSLELSLIDINKAKQQLNEYLKDYSDYNIVICPMNTKISTIATGLVAIDNPDIQLIYALANQYNIEGYSKPSEDMYFNEVIL